MKGRGVDILFCTHEPLLPLSGGCTIGNLRLVQGFVRRGHRVRVLSPLNLPLAQAQAQVPGVELIPYHPGAWAAASACVPQVPGLRRALRPGAGSVIDSAGPAC